MRGVRPSRIDVAWTAFASNLRHPPLLRAQLSFAAAWTAEAAFTVALAIVAYRDGGAAAVGLVGLLRMAPAAFLAPLLAPLADRWRRSVVLVAVSVLRAVATALAAAVLVLDGSTALVYVLAALATVAATLFRPAHSALLPSLCRSPHDLASANLVRGLLDSAATLLGPLAAALLLDAFGVSAVLFAAAACSALAALLLVRLPDARPQIDARAAGVLADVGEGIRTVARSRDLLLLIVLGAAQTFTRGAVTVLTVVVAVEVLERGEVAVAALTAAVGAGAVVASLTAPMLLGTRGLARWFGVGVVLWGLPLVLLAVVPGYSAALALLSLLGVGNALVDVGLFTVMSRVAPDHVLGRVYGVLEAVVTVSVGIGAAVTPALLAVLGHQGALVAIGLVGPLLALGAWARLRRLDQELGVREDDIALLHAVPMLQPLPLPSVERLARGLSTCDVAAGDDVVKEGERGDLYYLIESGTAEVFGADVPLGTLGPGEAFGEIALLRAGVRTATIRALSPLRLRTLSRECFLPVVTGDTRTGTLARAEAAAHLARYAPGDERV